MVARLTPSAAAIVLADSPPACIRCARAAFAVETTDLLDANETIWTFTTFKALGVTETCRSQRWNGWAVEAVVETTAD